MVVGGVKKPNMNAQPLAQEDFYLPRFVEPDGVTKIKASNYYKNGVVYYVSASVSVFVFLFCVRILHQRHCFIF